MGELALRAAALKAPATLKHGDDSECDDTDINEMSLIRGAQSSSASNRDRSRRSDDVHGEAQRNQHRAFLALAFGILVVLMCSMIIFKHSNSHDMEAAEKFTKESDEATSRGQDGSSAEPPMKITKDKRAVVFNNTIAEELQIPHVVYDDLQYRRICSPVGIGSVLCMIVKFPFPLAEQDPTVHWPSPFEPKFYSIDKKKGIIFLDQDAVQKCEMQTLDLVIDDAVKQCIDQTAAANANKVVAVWTRRRYDGTTHFHSTGLAGNIKNVYDYFGDDHMILTLGASPSPGVTKETQTIFGPQCQMTGVNRHKGNWNCDRPGSRRLENLPYSTMEEGHVNFGQLGYCPSSPHGRYHTMPKQNLTELLDSHHIRTDAARKKKSKRLLSFLIEYPIAHTQSEEEIRNSQKHVQELNYNFIASLMVYMKSESGKRELADLGFALGTIFVFDGLPQYFPTETAAFRFEISKRTSEEHFLQQNGYGGWRPELGSACRGPLPPDSPLKGVAKMIRQAWIDQGLDMQWYGRTWEFANMFWFQTRNWKGKGGLLDCTHSGGPHGMYSMHKFFLQAMLDDYSETKHAD